MEESDSAATLADHCLLLTGRTISGAGRVGGGIIRLFTAEAGICLIMHNMTTSLLSSPPLDPTRGHLCACECAFKSS